VLYLVNVWIADIDLWRHMQGAKAMKQNLIGLILVLLFPMVAGAASFQDTQTFDNMFFSTSYYDGDQEITFVVESIADNRTIPYSSHDGHAVVNQ
jgi:glutamine amidotransferase-like uncharacterized protein